MTEEKQPLANKTDEKAATNFLTSFYVELDNLIITFSQYISVLINLERSSDSIEGELPDDLALMLENSVSNIRFRSIKAYLQYKAISSKVKDDDKKRKNTINMIYQENIICSKTKTHNYYIPRDKIQEFINLLNEYLMEKVITLIPENSESVYRKL